VNPNRLHPGPPWGNFPPIQPPFGPRLTADLVDNGTYPPLTPEDLQILAAEGLLPPHFWQGPSIEEMGRESAKILKTDFDLGVTLPETGEEVVARRGQVGDSFRGLQPLNLGRGTILSPGDTRVLIVQAKGLDCLTPVGAALGVNFPEGEESLEDTADVFIRAEVEWGVGGAAHHATVDVGRGTQIRVPAASFIRIYYNYTPDLSTTPPRTGPNVEGVALLGYGTPSFRPSPARFTQRVGTVNGDGGKSNVIPIPKFAQSYGVVGETASIAGWSALLLPALGNDGNGHSVFQPLTDGMLESQLPVPEGMTAIQLTNGTGTPQKANIIFTIML
jgi:hypothetical protein